MFKPHLLYRASNLYVSIVKTEGGHDTACLGKEGKNAFSVTQTVHNKQFIRYLIVIS